MRVVWVYEDFFFAPNRHSHAMHSLKHHCKVSVLSSLVPSIA